MSLSTSFIRRLSSYLRLRAVPCWIALTLLPSASSGTLFAQLSSLHGQVGTPSIAGGGASYYPQFSQDGRRILFLSYANNLVTNDDRGFALDAFVHDLETSITHLVSAGASGVSGANEDVRAAAISPAGHTVVFSSAANTLLSDDPTGTNRSFLRDITEGLTTVLITNLSTGAVARVVNCSLPSPIPVFAHPTYSADGLVLVFESYATNLVANDTNNVSDIFALTLATSEIVLVSVGTPSEVCPGIRRSSFAASVSANGSRVAYVSTAVEINPNARPEDIYIRDLPSATTAWASRDVRSILGQTNGAASYHPALSEDGRAVVFLANTGGSSNAFLLFHDIDRATTSVISSNTPATSFPAISTNGQVVTYTEGTQIYQYYLSNSVRSVLSVDANGSNGANGISHSPAVTPDGRFVAFLSDATDLVPGNLTRGFRIYRRDIFNGTTQLVTPAEHLADEANHPVISQDGRRIAFESKAPLVPGDRNRLQDIFVFDATTGSIELVSRVASGLQSETGPSHVRISREAISADGRFVAYETMEHELFPNDTNRLSDAFVYDGALRTNIFLGDGSVSPPVGGLGLSLETLLPRVSANGRYVAFAERPFSVTASSPMRLLRRDLFTGETLLIADAVTSRVGYPLSLSADGSRVLYGTTANQAVIQDVSSGSIYRITNSSGVSAKVSLSRNGRWALAGGFDAVVFDLDTAVSFNVGNYEFGAFSADSRSLILYHEGLIRLELETRLQRPLWQPQSLRQASVSANGTVVAFQVPLSAPQQIIVLDVTAGTTNYLTPQTGSFISSHPLITYDGRYVAFLSTTTNHSSNDPAGTMDLFVHDRSSGQTVSITAASGLAASLTTRASAPILGADGRSILFMSLAQDLIPKDFNGFQDVFILQLGSDDSDDDALDDDWEWAYFSILARDGAGDFDGDGSSDLAEFRAGTDPTNQGSVFRVLTISRMGTDQVNLVWHSVPGKVYQVQSRDVSLGTGWINVAGTVTAQGFSAGASVVRNSQDRFFRVVLAE